MMSEPKVLAKHHLVDWFFFWSCIKNKAITDEVIKTDKAILNSRENAIVTPSKAECAKVSPKYDSLLQTTKHPNGPVTKATPIPANKALIKKSSNILIFLF